MTTTHAIDDVKTIYARRFSGKEDYRQRVWDVLVSDFFFNLAPPGGAVLDLGCGHGEFINQVNGATRYAMDLNPDSGSHLDAGVCWLQQDCAAEWPLSDGVLDLVFTSNLFEHLPDKSTLVATLKEAYRCLRPGGHFVALGPNIKYVGGAYWDFWDHHLPLTDASMAEVLETVGFKLQRVVSRFLPYSMSGGRRYPLLFLRIYLRLPMAWWLFGRQFLIVATK
jgi:SAM-dependent methyltransferase